MTSFISYAMLNSGAWQKLTAMSVDDTMVAMARAWLDEDGFHRDILPGLGLDFASTATGSWVLCSLIKDGDTIAEIAIAKRSIGAKDAWKTIHDGAPDLPTASQAPPPAPWVALSLRPAMGRQPKFMALTAIALAKSAAWAWIEKD